MPTLRPLLFLLFALAAGCKTTIVSADPYTGIEQTGERRLRLALDRVRLKLGESAAGPAGAVCYACGEGEEASVSSVLIPFIATNDSKEG
jgi:hypothetical protein